MDRLSTLHERAAPGDHSLAGAIFPELFERERKQAELESQPNDAGLSIIALLEGSAVVPAELLMGGSAGALVLAESQLPIVPPIYRSLFDLTVERYGDRALELILPATALALRYTVRTTLISNWLPPSRKTGAVIRSRAGAKPQSPQVPEAGPILGTATDVHQPTETFSVYDSILRDLSDGKWRVDSYACWRIRRRCISY
jgi:hypothetical protein